MIILFIGDIVGRAGRTLVRRKLPELQSRVQVDLTIANVENTAGGFGLTPPLATRILSWGVDVMTSGNHIFDKREIFDYMDGQPLLLRPGNYPPGTPGAWRTTVSTPSGVEVTVANLQGRVFMPLIDCPFRLAEKELDRPGTITILDFHAEATSEKVAMGWFLDGRVSAVLGTHTHIPTADARVLPGGTAYITDVGMTGPYDSVIGMKRKGSIARFLTGLGARFEPAAANPKLCGVVIDIDEKTGKARRIERVEE